MTDVEFDLVSSAVYPGLERKPGGPDNWVERAGGLPSYIERIAKHLHYEKGMTISRAIAVAVNTVKRWARMGKVAKYGSKEHVTAKTAALAAKAVAEWEAKKAAGHVHLSDELLAVIEASEVSEEYALHLAEQVLDEAGAIIDLASDTMGVEGAGADETEHGTLCSMDISDLAERANRIEDPTQRAAARARVLELAVPASQLTAEKRKQAASKGQAMSDGSFPITDKNSLKSAIRLAQTPAQRRHVIARARALGCSHYIPDSWNTSLAELAVQGLVDLASTIAPRNARGRVRDGRRSYKGQGKFRHGFIPVDQAAKEAKAKGSPIAIKRLNRLYGTTAGSARSAPGAYQKSARGRAGQRSAGDRKINTETVRITEGKEGAKGSTSGVAFVNARQAAATNRSPKKVGGQFKEASKETRTPERARQNWDEIPEKLKTVRNGKRFVVAEYADGQYITPWVGGVQGVTGGSTDQRKVYATLSAPTAANMSSAQLRDVINNPRTPDAVKKVARQGLRDKAKAANK